MKAPPFHVFEFGDFRLDVEERVLLRRDGPAVPLTPRVFETLHYLVEHSGRVAEKESLMEAVWPDCIVEENNLAQNISTLRRIFGDTAGAPRYIATIPGRGYRFIAPVKTGNGSAVAGIDHPGLDRHVSPITRGSTIPATTSAASPVARGRAGSVVVAVTVLVVLCVTFFWWRNTPRQTAASPITELTVSIPENSIAVLPFANLSSDPDTAYFAEGVKDEILTRLSKIAALKVISRTSTQEFAGQPHNVREIARRLSVTHILEGSVQKAGDTARVTVQLIHAPTDTHLWAESYDRKLTDVLQVESEIAQRVATALATTVTGAEKRALTATSTTNVKAYEEYLRGRYFWNKRTAEGFREAVLHLSRAVELDPAYARAYAGLADAVYFLGFYDPAGYEGAFRKSRGLLEKALSLDETLGEAHASLGLLAMNSEWDWPKAERHFKRALELNSNYATAHQWYGEFLAYMTRFDEAIAESTRARELDPLSLIINTDLAKVHTLARRYGEAIAQYEVTLKMDPEFTEALALVGLTYSAAGRHEEAIASLSKIRNLNNHPAYLSFLAYAYAVAGQTDKGRQTIERVNELSKTTYVSPYWLAMAWASLDKEQAFHYLEEVMRQHAPSGGISLKVNPTFDPLRSDPRYSEILQRANFAP